MVVRIAPIQATGWHPLLLLCEEELLFDGAGCSAVFTVGEEVGAVPVELVFAAVDGV